MSEGSAYRDYRGVEGAVEDAEKGKEGAPDERQKFPRGRVGTGRPKPPRTGVRDPGKPYEGPEGEKAYGPPIDDRPEDRGKK